jgi:hypothetical protein
MSHFYGTLQGNRSQVTRCGSRASGIEATAASWEGAVNAYVYRDEDLDRDIAVVRLIPWHGAGTSRILYRGPVSGAPTCDDGEDG